MKHWRWSLLNAPVFSVFLFVMIITSAPKTVSGDLYPPTLKTAMGDLYPRPQSPISAPAAGTSTPAAKSPAPSPAPPPPSTSASSKSSPAKKTSSVGASKTISSSTTAKTTTSSNTTKQTTNKSTQPAKSTTTASSPSQATSQSSKISAIIATAKQYIGVNYVYGGTTPAGFDCSGFVQYVFAKNGITLPRVSRDQYKIGTSVSFSSLKAGDLVFFSLAKNGIVDHVGIDVGNGQFINASSSKGVTIYTLGPYWQSVFLGAKRVL